MNSRSKINTKQAYKKLSQEELLKKRNTLKSSLIGIGVVWAILILAFIGIVIVQGFDTIPFAAMIPIFTLPITLLPFWITINQLDEELKSRNK